MIWWVLGILILLLMTIDYMWLGRVAWCRQCRVITVTSSLPSPTYLRGLVEVVRANGKHEDPRRNGNRVSTLKLNAPQCRALAPLLYKHFTSPAMLEGWGEAIGERLSFSDARDPNRMFIKLYQGGDYIDWHYDNNFSRGRRYTIVLPLVESEDSASTLEVRGPDGDIVQVDTVPGRGVIFDASDVSHRVTPQKEGSYRMVLVIPLYTDPTLSTLGRMKRGLHNHVIARVFSV